MSWRQTSRQIAQQGRARSTIRRCRPSRGEPRSSVRVNVVAGRAQSTAGSVVGGTAATTICRVPGLGNWALKPIPTKIIRGPPGNRQDFTTRHGPELGIAAKDHLWQLSAEAELAVARLLTVTHLSAAHPSRTNLRTRRRPRCLRCSPSQRDIKERLVENGVRELDQLHCGRHCRLTLATSAGSPLDRESAPPAAAKLHVDAIGHPTRAHEPEPRSRSAGDNIPAHGPL
jgi:hypothetical protein